MQMSGNLIDVGICASEQMQHFLNLRHIQSDDHAVNSRLSQKRAEVRTARQRHVLLNQIIFFLHRLEVHTDISGVCHHQSSCAFVLSGFGAVSDRGFWSFLEQMSLLSGSFLQFLSEMGDE